MTSLRNLADEAAYFQDLEIESLRKQNKRLRAAFVEAVRLLPKEGVIDLSKDAVQILVELGILIPPASDHQKDGVPT
jgi:hypothetical protein